MEQAIERQSAGLDAPAIAVMLYLLGALAAAVGGIFIVTAMSAGGDASEGFIIGLATLFVSPFLFGFGYALRKLQQIEFHLRP